MGPQLASLTFPTTVPATAELVAEAERLSGLQLQSAEQSQTQATIAFSELPDARVTINRKGVRLSVVDYSQVAPVLFNLLLIASVNLGGRLEREFALPPLSLPLDLDDVRKGAREVYATSALFSAGVLLVLITGIAVLAGTAWFLMRDAQ